MTLRIFFLISSNLNESFTWYKTLGSKFFHNFKNIILYYWDVWWSSDSCNFMDDIFSLSKGGKSVISLFLIFFNFIKMFLIAWFLIFLVLHYFVSPFKWKAFYLSFIIENSISIIFSNIPSIQFLYNSLFCQLLLSDFCTSISSCHFLAFIFFGLSIFSYCLLREFFKLIFQIY